MNRLTFSRRNATRNRFRTVFTVLGVSIAVLTFVTLRTVVVAWNVSADYAAKDRLGVRHKSSVSLSLPKRYVEAVRATPGVSEVCHITWFGGKDPRDSNNVFATLAMGERCLDVFDEMTVDPARRRAWMEDRRGALVGDLLARRLGVKVGDRVTLQSTVFPGDWEFEVSGIYTVGKRPFDRAQFIFHWDYLNDSVPERLRDQVGWMVLRVDDATRGPAISKQIDQMFEEKDVPTSTMSIRAMSLSYLGLLSAVISAVDFASLIILVIMTLVLGNTISMGVRERTREYGVLRALGFSPRQVGLFIIGEAMAIGFAGGLLGLGASYLLVDRGLGTLLEENMGHIFPYFRVNALTFVAAFVLAVLLPIPAALLPAYRTYKLSIPDALRRLA